MFPIHIQLRKYAREIYQPKGILGLWVAVGEHRWGVGRLDIFITTFKKHIQFCILTGRKRILVRYTRDAHWM